MKDNKVIKPVESKKFSMYPFNFPVQQKIRAKVICANLNISLASFVRDAVSERIKKYENMLNMKWVEVITT